MKKLIAILFLSLICLTTVSGKIYLFETGYELITDSEGPEIENKEGKKEIKEFTSFTHNNYAAPSLIFSYKVHRALFFPQPLPDQQTPPPDLTC